MWRVLGAGPTYYPLLIQQGVKKKKVAVFYVQNLRRRGGKKKEQITRLRKTTPESLSHEEVHGFDF